MRKWGKRAVTELLPVELTDTIDEVCENIRRRTLVVRGAAAASSGDANLTLEWVGKMRYEHPATWTEAEAKRHFLRLSAQAARNLCIDIIELLPAEVVPTILPQLEDLAEYEIRMQRVREEAQRPGITETWISLPITA
jgi:hypothetical protein